MAIDSEPVRLFTTPGRRNAQVYSLGKFYAISCNINASKVT